MAKPFLIIDAYNLLHAAGMARRNYGPGDLEKCRKHLLNYLAGRLNPSERQRTTIVFDAGDAPYNAPRQMIQNEMTILFPQRGGDADTLIEKLVAKHSAPRQILVVSSDHRLQKAAHKRRGHSVDSEIFFAELEERKSHTEQTDRPQRDPDPKFTGQVSAGETDALMEIFGDASDIKKIDEEDNWNRYLNEIPDNLDDLLDEDGTSTQ